MQILSPGDGWNVPSIQVGVGKSPKLRIFSHARLDRLEETWEKILTVRIISHDVPPEGWIAIDPNVQSRVFGAMSPRPNGCRNAIGAGSKLIRLCRGGSGTTLSRPRWVPGQRCPGRSGGEMRFDRITIDPGARPWVLGRRRPGLRPAQMRSGSDRN